MIERIPEKTPALVYDKGIAIASCPARGIRILLRKEECCLPEKYTGKDIIKQMFWYVKYFRIL